VTARWERLRDDRGTTLLELVVAMAIMLIFLGIFTGGIIVISKSQAKTNSIGESSGQINQAFLWLDKNVRYSAAITTPGQGTSADWYVELRNTTSGTEVCTQVRLDAATAKLQRRSWTPSGSTASGLTCWIAIASGITNGSADVPFVSPSAAVGSERFQQLKVTLVALNNATTSRSQLTFTAINSTLPKSSAAVCQEAGRP
jgi:prepilin-type N-terminal cleavage/methylation domain-containing protein